MRTPSLRLAMLIVALVAFGAAAAGVGVRAAYDERTTADEPHYLVTAISIWSDGDLDVYDEFLHRDYAPFDGLILRPRAAPTRDGQLIEPHDPLLPVLLAVPTGLGSWVAAELTLCLIAAALAALTCGRRCGASPCRSCPRPRWSGCWRPPSRWPPTVRRSTRRSPAPSARRGPSRR